MEPDSWTTALWSPASDSLGVSGQPGPTWSILRPEQTSTGSDTTNWRIIRIITSVNQATRRISASFVRHKLNKATFRFGSLTGFIKCPFLHALTHPSLLTSLWSQLHTNAFLPDQLNEVGPSRCTEFTWHTPELELWGIETSLTALLPEKHQFEFPEGVSEVTSHRHVEGDTGRQSGRTSWVLPPDLGAGCWRCSTEWAAVTLSLSRSLSCSSAAAPPGDAGRGVFRGGWCACASFSMNDSYNNKMT